MRIRDTKSNEIAVSIDHPTASNVLDFPCRKTAEKAVDLPLLLAAPEDLAKLAADMERLGTLLAKLRDLALSVQETIENGHDGEVSVRIAADGPSPRSFP